MNEGCEVLRTKPKQMYIALGIAKGKFSTHSRSKSFKFLRLGNDMTVVPLKSDILLKSKFLIRNFFA